MSLHYILAVHTLPACKCDQASPTLHLTVALHAAYNVVKEVILIMWW